jgi:hypothetical protein
MEKMMEQMAQMVAPVKTTTWGGLHGSLALVLDDMDYATVTKNIVTSLALLTKPTTINPKINKLSNPYEIRTLQEEMKTLQEEFELKEAVTTIGVQLIIDSVEEQYVKKIQQRLLWLCKSNHQNAPNTPLNKMEQGCDKRAHQCNRGILSGVGPLDHPHHHLWPCFVWRSG